MANLADLAPIMVEVAARTTVAEFLRGAVEHDVPAAPILSLDDLPGDPQVAHNQVFVETSHPRAGRLREVRPAPRFASTPARVSSPAPMPGEHTDAVLTELGVDATRVSDLRAAGVVF
jgi:formyl-CoA transferase